MQHTARTAPRHWVFSHIITEITVFLGAPVDCILAACECLVKALVVTSVKASTEPICGALLGLGRWGQADTILAERGERVKG
jgi:hypothetical protein